MIERRRNSDSGKSPLQALKDLPAEDRDALVRKREEGFTVAQILAQIEAHHGIAGLSSQRWSDFLRWQARQRYWAQAQDAVADLRETFAAHLPGGSDDAVHAYLVDLVKSMLATTEDPELQAGLLKFAVVETRKRMEISHAARRIELLEAQAREALQAAENPTLSADEKTARIREIFKR